MAFVEDSLVHANGLTHHGEHVTEEEELTPTLENTDNTDFTFDGLVV